MAPLSCYCDQSNSYNSWYFPPNDYEIYSAERGKRCNSCKKTIIRKNNLCIKFERERNAISFVERKIYNEEPIKQAPKYFCEQCADIYFNLY